MNIRMIEIILIFIKGQQSLGFELRSAPLHYSPTEYFTLKHAK